ncbi:DUF4124 domain-containing protein [Accumulibacter sp.]|uniref:DUF4124 domain-containing protein n=1 Tax=Accumulibacter sp. TaxID=2053492 RepID=UPI0025ED889B|nr:DUF4124 domain-containing protein [Accumulibacter sp.]MCM8596127.1 DUF4124 domain-containing protein [Accumulibacter sp.]MCM8627915.1 DUF4124 domain-containing protein [Accumulibacter sp.]MDS4050276.1 DUF4124 domain-containing protein [Accumulibacter sp.]
MKPFLPALVALSLASAASAQIYQWQDENNRTVISDRPPSGPVRQQKKIDAPAPPATAEAAKTTADRELDFRKRQKEARDTADKAEKEQQTTAQRKENCDSARNWLQVLESGERVARRDSAGERYYLDDAQRQQEIVKARQAVQETCK